MRRLIDLDQLWRDALRLACADFREYGIDKLPDFPTECPFGIDELLGEDFDIREAVGRIRTLSG